MRKQHTPLQLPHTDILPEIVEPLLTWYRGQSTLRCLPWREEVTPYHTWISEIMLQQTRASAVIPYYTRFLEALPDIASLAHCDDELLMKLWQGLGYYNRARNLKKAACQIVEDFGGQMPADFAALLALPGALYRQRHRLDCLRPASAGRRRQHTARHHAHPAVR